VAFPGNRHRHEVALGGAVRPLKTALGPYGHTQILKDGRVKPAGFTLDFIEISPMNAGFRKMVRNLEYDICEVAITTYLVAKEFNKAFTALPIPLNHMFHFGDVQVGTNTEINGPRDLAGKRVGVRAYTVTTGVWVRGILQNEYGVDPATITWVTDDEEHVLEYKPPRNVIASNGATLVDLFQCGDIDAAFSGRAGLGRTGAKATREFRPLFSDADRLDAEWCARTGIYPIHGVLCVRNDVLTQFPDLPRALYDAFVQAKALFLTELARDGAKSAEDARWQAMQSIVGDPLPFGLEANRRTIETMIGYALDQHLIEQRRTPEELFAPII
jgi:4,5-dihydroxyphthalate decarboxylase